MRHLMLTILMLLVPSTLLAGFAPRFQGSGTLGVEVTGVAGGNTVVTTGTLTLNNLPPGAVIQQATLYASQTNQGGGLDAFFGGTNLGASTGSISDAALVTLYTYTWNVTPNVVSGINAYSFTIGQNSPQSGPIAGVALSVVWSHPAESPGSVVLIDGMQQVGESGAETENMTFPALAGGPTDICVFTVNDDNASTGETISWNGTGIGGPIDRNLGFDASIFHLTATSANSGTTNTLSISTGSDHMGWMIGAVKSLNPPVSVEPKSWGSIKLRP